MALTVHRTVIHYHGDASLTPRGRAKLVSEINIYLVSRK